jgi:hypothetical protein
MIAKTSCQHCGIHLEFDAESANQFISCPSCGQQTRLILPSPAKPSPQPKFNAPAAVPILSQTEKHLALIRKKSCYPQLRFIINVCFLLLLIAIGISALILVGAASDQDEGVLLVKRILFILGCASLAVALLIAIRQSALLMIDIADTLLHEHAKTTDTGRK